MNKKIKTYTYVPSFIKGSLRAKLYSIIHHLPLRKIKHLCSTNMPISKTVRLQSNLV